MAINPFDSVEIGPITITVGTGNPEQVIDAPQGSLFMRTDGFAANEHLYIKETPAGNTSGWRRVPSNPPTFP